MTAGVGAKTGLGCDFDCGQCGDLERPAMRCRRVQPIRTAPAARATIHALERVRGEYLTAEDVSRHTRRRRGWVLRECVKAEAGQPSSFPGARRDAPLRPWRVPVSDVLAFLRR